MVDYRDWAEGMKFRPLVYNNLEGVLYLNSEDNIDVIQAEIDAFRPPSADGSFSFRYLSDCNSYAGCKSWIKHILLRVLVSQKKISLQDWTQYFIQNLKNFDELDHYHFVRLIPESLRGSLQSLTAEAFQEIVDSFASV